MLFKEFSHPRELYTKVIETTFTLIAQCLHVHVSFSLSYLKSEYGLTYKGINKHWIPAFFQRVKS